MPVYEYRCVEGHTFERILLVAEYLSQQFCACGNSAQKVILHPPKVFSDLDGYESPASGKWIAGRRARTEDFARTGTRPYELGETKRAVEYAQAADKELDAQIDQVVGRTIDELSNA